jgi:hypothetical protein
MLIEVKGCQSCPFCNNDNEYGKDQCNLDTDIFAKKLETLPSEGVHEKCPIKKHMTVTVELSSTCH